MSSVNLSKKVFPLTLTALVLLMLFTASCMIPLKTDEPKEPFQFTAAGGSRADTISPFGPLILTFTRPVSNPDSVHFIFAPLFTEYQVLWSDSHDTAKLYFSLPLDGNANYTVMVADKIESTDGSILIPGKDTIRILTNYCEQEPNDSKDLADLLQGVVFGHIAMANDTDWFEVSDTAKRTFYLKSTGSTSFYTISDSRGMTIQPGTYADADTLIAPMDFVPPLYLQVYSYNHSNGGSYELGWVKGK